MRPSSWFGPLLVLVAVMPLGGGLGCSDCEVTGQPPIDHFEGSSQEGYHETSGWNDEWLYFPQGRTYRIYHHLGTENYVVTTYVGFDPRPLDERGAAENSGNMGMIEKVTPQYYQIRNDTCAELYLRTVAVVHGGVGGMGGSDG